MYRREHLLHRRLAELSGSIECLGYDACPGPGGLLYNIDGYHEDYSRYPFMSRADWAYRAVVASAADVIASGGRPLAVMYSVGVELEAHALEVARGVGEAARDLGVVVLKSDYNRGRGSWIDVASIGSTSRPVSRKGASPGDVLLQAGYLGYGLLERLVAENIVGIDEALNVSGFLRRLPPRVEGIVSGYATASSDNSDGWAATLWGIAEYSGVRVIVEEVHPDPTVGSIVGRAGVSREAIWLESWEDYNIALTVREDEAEDALEDCGRAGVPCWIIGRIAEGDPQVVYKGRVVTGGWSWV
ncbi:MAG: AIR synthase related protein [Desulfurococcales archaeon]|nr:AIR synthase related protein [Desulfurococcales archaeon]